MPASAPAAPCPLCGGTGFVRLDVPLGHPDFGRALPCRCREQERLNRKVQSLQGMSSLNALQALTFESFIAEPSHLNAEKAYNLRRAYETSLQFAHDPDGWLVFVVTYGCGKTHLAAAIANARLALGEPALFMVVPDLLDHLRATYSPYSDVRYDTLFEQLRSAPLLILDDLGTQSSTPWAQEKLFQLLNHRYNMRLPTIITTNQSLDDMEPRLRSRLQDLNTVKVIPILAPDFRSGHNITHSKLSTLHLHREQTFASFDEQRRELPADERVNLREVFAYCQAFARQPTGWLVLSGRSGSGKTHLAAAVANARADQSEPMFIVVPDLLDHLRAAFSPQSGVSYDRLFDAVKNAALLILDDLGIESATPWAKEKLYQLLNHRYNARLSTVITTTATPDELEPWLRTRMFDTERCRFCALIASPFRRAREGSPRGRHRSE